jgi:molybdate transport system regulatory protein
VPATCSRGSTAETTVSVLAGTVRERDGELGVVETKAVELRALVPPEATAVQVSLRADAVTLQSPGSAPPESRTSARNRFRGTVTGLERGERVVSVTLDVGAGESLSALVTARSADLLDLSVGCEVVATVKATTIRAVPRRGDGPWE